MCAAGENWLASLAARFRPLTPCSGSPNIPELLDLFRSATLERFFGLNLNAGHDQQCMFRLTRSLFRE